MANRFQVFAKANPKIGWSSRIIFGQRWTRTTGPTISCVPNPSEIENSVFVSPLHVGIDIRISTVTLSQLSSHQREAPSNPRQYPAATRKTGCKVISVIRGNLSMGRIRRAMRKPASHRGYGHNRGRPALAAAARRSTARLPPTHPFPLRDITPPCGDSQHSPTPSRANRHRGARCRGRKGPRDHCDSLSQHSSRILKRVRHQVWG